jgi:hypothetical protein
MVPFGNSNRSYAIFLAAAVITTPVVVERVTALLSSSRAARSKDHD